MTNASDIMTKNIVAARANTSVREIGTRLLIGNFNGLPVVDNNIKLIGVVTAVVDSPILIAGFPGAGLVGSISLAILSIYDDRI